MDKDAQVLSGKHQLKQFGLFLDEHDSKLNKLLTQNNNDDYFQFYKNNGLDKITRKFYSPIKINLTTDRENISIFNLLESDNKILNKIILTFTKLCNEAELVVNDAREHQLKFLYLDENLYNYEECGHTEECYVAISDSLEFLCNIQLIIQRCFILSGIILQQLGALYMNDKQLLGVNFNVQFQAIFDSLGNTAMQLVIFDEILSNSNFSKYWSSYKKTINSITRSLDKFPSFTTKEIAGLANIINELEIIFAGNLFQAFLDSTFRIKEQITSKALGTLSNQYQDYIKTNLNIIEKFNNDLSEFQETELIIRINILSIFYHNFFGQIDQKQFRHLIDINIKYTGITLIGNIVWCPEPFLKKHGETLMKNYDKYLQDSSRMRQLQLQNKIQRLQCDSKSYCIQISLWALHLNTSLQAETYELKIEQFKQFSTLLLQGIQFAGQISHMIKSITNLHILLHAPMNKNILMLICKLIEYLKTIQLIFSSNIEIISKTIHCVIQYLQYKALFIISAAKKKLTSDSLNDRSLDSLAALQISEKCLFGPMTRSRLLITNLAINAANSSRAFTSDYYQKLIKTINRLDLISKLQINLDRLCDTSFLYWHQSILPIYLKQIVERKTDFNTFHYVVKSSDDCSKFIEQLDLNRLKLIETLKKSNYDNYKREIIDKLCAQTEIFLRLEVHSQLQQDKVNPLEQSYNDYRDLLALNPIQLNGEHVIIKDNVENYLSTMFYNLTTISLHDWRTYGEMRRLAFHKLNLDTIEDHLPTQTLEQGIDVLEIMRNIHIFVSKYLYNMNNQIFIEHSSNNKHLNTIGIKHIANSLRTHGTGIINTTVNFTYQFLRKKFYTFSQFLFDEQIKSRLMKDLKYFRENKEKLNNMYSYERADSFNKGIRKLGLTPDGQSYLDLFRQLIAHIGNAMGYIRLVRSGSIHASYSASAYIPKFDENLNFYKYSEKLTETTINAAENLEMNIKNLTKNFSEGTEYFKLLMDAFSPFFRDPKNIHLKTFYLIIPPLTINFVEYMLNSKDKIYKKDKQGALFVDDGFTIGLIYVLKLLNQTTEFNSLEWFKSVIQKYTNELNKVKKQREQLSLLTTNHDEKLQQTLSLTEKRINAYQMEFTLLYYNLSSAKIFFQ